MRNAQQVASRLDSKVRERFDSVAEFCRFLEGEGLKNADSTVSRYLNRRPGNFKAPRIEWVLRVADLLNIDYVWLFTGSREGWDRFPRKRVTVELENERSVEFLIPAEWEEHLDMKFSIPTRDISEISVMVEEVD